uniref:Uncharacterized protein n=1 Tax=viral metagenome TaxID=1070528 RepID=A0A6C0LTK6_9ZZZZ
MVYYFVTYIEVKHIDSLSEIHRNELLSRNKIRSMLINNHLRDIPSGYFEDNKLLGYIDKYSSEQFQSTNYKHNYYDFTGEPIELPNASNLLMLIKSEFMDEQYRFNIPNQPVTTRYPCYESYKKDSKLLKQLRLEVESWNVLFYKYYQTNEKLIQIKDIKMVFIQETQHEFIVKVNIALSYLYKSMHYQLTFYGQIDKTDDIINNPIEQYTLQLINIIPIMKSEYFSDIENETPFLTMQDQLKYVDKINKLHQNEDN